MNLSKFKILWILAVFTLSASALANSELDKRYGFASIGILKTWDNVDGIFSEYITGAYRDFFSRQSRFAVQESTKIDALLVKSSLPYKQIIDDPEILSQIAKSARVDTLLRTKVIKEGPQYTFRIDWLLAPQMFLLGTDTFVLDEVRNPKGLEGLKESVQKSLAKTIAKVPFFANLTGRDGDAVTVNIGANVELKKGDTLVVATVDDAKHHPLLHAVVDWRLTPTGRVEIEQVDESIAFGKIVFEEEGQSVMREQKVVRVIPKPVDVMRNENGDEEKPSDDFARNGYAAGGLSLGSLTREKSSGTAGVTGSGLLWGGDAEGQLWLTRKLFLDLGLKLASSSFDQTDQTTGEKSFNGGSSMTVSQFRFDGGYRYHLTSDFYGPQVGFKLGYHTISYNFQSLSPSAGAAVGRTDPISFDSVFLGLAGDLPLAPLYGVLVDLNFGIFSSASESGTGATPVDNASDGSFFLGFYYRLEPKITLRGGVNFQVNSAEYGDGTKASYKVVTFSPAILYYF